MQATSRARRCIQFYVGAAPGHTGSHGHGTSATCLRDDGCFFGIKERIEYLVRDALPVQQLGETLRIGHAVRADQYRTPVGAQSPHTISHSSKHRVGLRKHACRQPRSPTALVQRDTHHHCSIDPVQFRAGLAQGTAGTTQAPIALEKALKRGLGQRFGFGGWPQALLHGHQRMQAARPDPARCYAPADQVQQLDGTCAYQVVFVPVVDLQCGQRQCYRFAPVTRPLPGPSQTGARQTQCLFALWCQYGQPVGSVQCEVAAGL